MAVVCVGSTSLVISEILFSAIHKLDGTGQLDVYYTALAAAAKKAKSKEMSTGQGWIESFLKLRSVHPHSNNSERGRKRANPTSSFEFKGIFSPFVKLVLKCLKSLFCEKFCPHQHQRQAIRLDF